MPGLQEKYNFIFGEKRGFTEYDGCFIPFCSVKDDKKNQEYVEEKEMGIYTVEKEFKMVELMYDLKPWKGKEKTGEEKTGKEKSVWSLCISLDDKTAADLENFENQLYAQFLEKRLSIFKGQYSKKLNYLEWKNVDDVRADFNPLVKTDTRNDKKFIQVHLNEKTAIMELMSTEIDPKTNMFYLKKFILDDWYKSVHTPICAGSIIGYTHVRFYTISCAPSQKIPFSIKAGTTFFRLVKVLIERPVAFSKEEQEFIEQEKKKALAPNPDNNNNFNTDSFLTFSDDSGNDNEHVSKKNKLENESGYQRLNFLKSLKTCEQRTVEWHNIRDKLLFTGSAVANALNRGYDKKNCRKDFVREKVEGIVKKKNMFVKSALEHGNTYEDIAKLWFERNFGVKCFDIGITTYAKASPDVYGWHLNKEIQELFTLMGGSPDGITDEKNPLLVEFKCPMARKYKPECPVPYYYIDQVQFYLHMLCLSECHFVQYFHKNNPEEQFIHTLIPIDEDWLDDNFPLLLDLYLYIKSNRLAE